MFDDDDDDMHYEMNTEDDEPSGSGNGPGKGCLWVCLNFEIELFSKRRETHNLA